VPQKTRLREEFIGRSLRLSTTRQL
jgi:hypothetical protein